MDETRLPLSINAHVERLRNASPQRRAAIGARTIRAAITRGELEALRVGPRLLILVGAFDRWLDSRRLPEPPAPDPAARERACVAARARVAQRASLGAASRERGRDAA